MRSLQPQLFIVLFSAILVACVGPEAEPENQSNVFDDDSLGYATLAIGGHSWDIDIDFCVFSPDGELNIKGDKPDDSSADQKIFEVTRGFDDDGIAGDRVLFESREDEDSIYRYQLPNDDNQEVFDVDSSNHTVTADHSFHILEYPDRDFEEPGQTEEGSLSITCEETTDVPTG